MFGCRNSSLYFLDSASIVQDFEELLNEELDCMSRRNRAVIRYSRLRRLPVFGHYVRIQTKFYLRSQADLEYNYDLLKEVLDQDLCFEIAKYFAKRNKSGKEKTFWFSWVSGRKYGKNYIIIFWR